MKYPSLFSSHSTWLILVLASLAGAQLTVCGGQVPLTASSGAELSIIANPTSIPVIDGVSTITVTGFKSVDDGGGTLSNGTQIFFTTNVGIIEERVEMKNGIARGFLRSNGRAGLATIDARSGSGITATLANPVLVGNATGINIVVTANPASPEPPGFTSQIVATVFDNDNNRMPAVPLIFSTSAGAMASAGSILTTNANGQAMDTLTLIHETSATVTVSSGAVTGSVTVGRGTAPVPIVTSVFPASGAPGETLNVSITGANFQPGAIVSFGQGVAVNSVTFINSTSLQVDITIDTNVRQETAGRTVTVTNPDGTSGSLSDAFRIVFPGAASPPIIINFNPPSSADRDPTSIAMVITGDNFQTGATVSFDPGGIIVDLSSLQVTSGGIRITGNFIVDITVLPGETFNVTVRNPDGQEVIRNNAFTAQ